MKALLPVLLLGLAGCNLFSTDPENRVVSGGEGRSISIGELEQSTKNFADRYVQLLADAAEDVKERTQEPKARREAHLLKLQSATSAWDVVTSSHPLQELLDLFVQVELQLLIWSEEELAKRFFGEDGGRRVSQALKSARQEILVIAKRALDDRQIADIQKLVRDWRRRNPSLETGSFVRFGPYLEAPGGTVVNQLLSGFGILDFSRWNPLNPTTKQVERVNETADDAFFMAKRLPMLLQWQAEAATLDILSSLDAAAVKAEGTLKTGGSVLKEATSAAKALEGTFEALAKVTNPEPDPEEEAREKAEGKPPSRPFDIREYESAVARLGETANRARDLLREVDDVAASPGLTARINQIGTRVERVLAQILVSVLLFLLVLFVLLAGYRAFSHVLARRQSRAPHP